MFERETRREKILEIRNKEQRLKERQKVRGMEDVSEKATRVVKFLKGTRPGKEVVTQKKWNIFNESVEDPIAEAEREFYDSIEKEKGRRLEMKKGPVDMWDCP